MNFEMALKSRSFILDLDRVMLSLGIFFFLSCLMESFHQLSGSTFIFCQKHTPKSRKFNVSPDFTSGKGFLVVPWSAIWSLLVLTEPNWTELDLTGPQFSHWNSLEITASY